MTMAAAPIAKKCGAWGGEAEEEEEEGRARFEFIKFVISNKIINKWSYVITADFCS